MRRLPLALITSPEACRFSVTRMCRSVILRYGAFDLCCTAAKNSGSSRCCGSMFCAARRPQGARLGPASVATRSVRRPCGCRRGCGSARCGYMRCTTSGSRAAAGLQRREESPGSTKQGWRVTPAGPAARRGKGKCHRKQTADGSPSQGGRTGKGERVRQERTGALATGLARQTPPGARPNRGLAPAACGRQECFAPRGPGWLLERCSNAPPR